MFKYDILKDIALFIRKEINDDKIDIKENSLLEDDLGITGEDGYELIIAFSKRYNVNIDNFIFSKYFYEEPNAFTIQSFKTSPLTVGDLVKAVRVGKLDDEVIIS